MRVKKIALACDHAGLEAKNAIKEMLSGQSYVIIDCGVDSSEPVDYPDIAQTFCAAVLQEQIPGVILCGSGIGVSIAANKIDGIRGALCHNELTARLARRHNDANVLALGARILGLELILEMVSVFLATEFDGGERHVRRVRKLSALEEHQK
jgi:ribose 5-phosphate isomerase B